MKTFTELLQQHGIALVFINILVEQAGLPVPAYPMLIVAGALAASGLLSWPACLLVAIIACLCTDTGWYLAGRRYGSAVLRTLCRVSLSPDSCVSNTEARFVRWGPKSLLVSKFIPGFNTIAPPMAGALRMRFVPFLLFTVGGSLLWAGSALAIGLLLHKSIDRVLDMLSSSGSVALLVLGSLLVAFIAYKAWQRHRLFRTLRMARITVAELATLMERGEPMLVIDARGPAQRELVPAMEGAIFMADANDAVRLDGAPRQMPVVVYCNCPTEASAAVVAKSLMDRGFLSVRPLVGGLDAWNARAASVN